NYQAQQDQIAVENPAYNYLYQGTYLVTLTVVDADQVTDSKTVEIVIEEGPQPPAEGQDPDSQEGGGIGPLLLTILKWVGIVLLTILILGVLLLGGLMLFLKIQNSELTFEEL